MGIKAPDVVRHVSIHSISSTSDVTESLLLFGCSLHRLLSFVRLVCACTVRNLKWLYNHLATNGVPMYNFHHDRSSTKTKQALQPEDRVLTNLVSLLEHVFDEGHEFKIHQNKALVC